MFKLLKAMFKSFGLGAASGLGVAFGGALGKSACESDELKKTVKVIKQKITGKKETEEKED